jgi:asparagine synthase (glutamine-hydrolysing)
MCGIVGFTGKKNAGILRKMCDSIIHRGPDENGYYEDDEISLGMRRLAIVDLASGQQPVFNETKEIVAVFNGEIYDHLLHRKELEQKHRFLTHHSDSEVIVHGYEEYGDQWAAKVNGMFAIAIWEEKRTDAFSIS